MLLLWHLYSNNRQHEDFETLSSEKSLNSKNSISLLKYKHKVKKSKNYSLILDFFHYLLFAKLIVRNWSCEPFPVYWNAELHKIGNYFIVFSYVIWYISNGNCALLHICVHFCGCTEHCCQLLQDPTTN